MKRLLLASVTLLTMSCFAQEQPKPNTLHPPITQNYLGCVIKLNPNTDGRYGYDISQGDKLLLRQPFNPFTMAPAGLRKSEDVFKVAQWQIQQLQSGAPAGTILLKPIPKSVAQLLNIDMN